MSKNSGKEIATAWAKVAMDMVDELRKDYAPGELGELDGVKAIRKLRSENQLLREVLNTAKNGLLWWCDQHPLEVDECDYDALLEIDSLLGIKVKE